MRSSSCLFLFCFIFSSYTFAQLLSPDSEPPFNAEGNWIVEYHDYPNKGEISKSAISVSKPFQMMRKKAPTGGHRWFFSRQQGDWGFSLTGGKGYFSWGGGNISVAGNKVSIKHPTLMLGNWGGVSEVSASGPNVMRGQWNYRQQHQGAEVWRRAIPRVEKVVFYFGQQHSEARPGQPARVVVPFSGPGNSMQGNRPSFYMSIYGKNLWGHQEIDLAGAIDLAPISSDLLEGDTKGLGPESIIGRGVNVIVWSQATPGRKTLWVNDQPIEFDLVITDYPYGDSLTAERQQACQKALDGAAGVSDEMAVPEFWDGWDTLEAAGDIMEEVAKDKPAEEMLKWSMDTIIEKMVREKNAEKLARLEAVYKRKLLKQLQSKGLFLNKKLPPITKAEIEALKKMYRYAPSIPQRMSTLVNTWKSLKRIQKEGVGSFIRGRIGRAFTAKLFSRIFGPVSTAMDLYEIYKFVRETEKLKNAWKGALESMEQAEGCNYELYEFRKNLSPDERRTIEDLRWREADYFRQRGLPAPIYPPWPGEAVPPQPDASVIEP